MLVPQKMISATSTALDNYGIVWIPLWSIVKFDRVVHFGMQLPVFSRIQAESDKDRIHTCKRSLL